MSQGALQFLGTIGAALLALGGIGLTVRQSSKQAKTNDAQTLFNDLQEERGELKKERTELWAEINRLRAEAESLRGELATLRRENMDLMDFVQDLRIHIRNGDPPPPPAWPEWAVRRGK